MFKEIKNICFINVCLNFDCQLLNLKCFRIWKKKHFSIYLTFTKPNSKISSSETYVSSISDVARSYLQKSALAIKLSFLYYTMHKMIFLTTWPNPWLLEINFFVKLPTVDVDPKRCLFNRFGQYNKNPIIFPMIFWLCHKLLKHTTFFVINFWNIQYFFASQLLMFLKLSWKFERYSFLFIYAYEFIPEM